MGTDAPIKRVTEEPRRRGNPFLVPKPVETPAPKEPVPA